MKCLQSEGGAAVPAQDATKKYRVDNLNRRGAMDLARRLEEYWHKEGYAEVRFWAEPVDERFEKIGTHEIYRVKSNLVNALPPSHPSNLT